MTRYTNDKTLRARSIQLVDGAGPRRTYLGFRKNEARGQFTRWLSSSRQVGVPHTVLFSSMMKGTMRDQSIPGDLGPWGDWGARVEAIVYGEYTAVPAWAANPPRWSGPAGRNRDAFRKVQPNVKVIALADALKQNMAFIRASRGVS